MSQNFSNQEFLLLKKGPGQIRNQDLCCLRSILFPRLSAQETARNWISLWTKAPPGVDESCEQSYSREKSIVPDCCKHNENWNYLQFNTHAMLQIRKQARNDESVVAFSVLAQDCPQLFSPRYLESMSPVNKIIYGKSIVTDCNTLACPKMSGSWMNLQFNAQAMLQIRKPARKRYGFLH